MADGSGNRGTLLVIGAGPKGLAIAAKQEVLRRLGFSLQANQKTREGTSHPDRNAQFEYINAQLDAFQAAGQPTISVDTKKKGVLQRHGKGFDMN